jgi:ubiquinone/menaquinone biosynthesis C-methylase UbiE
VFVPGIGTGLDIPAIPEGVAITGLDLSPDMLGKARERAAERDDVTLVHGDAEAVPLPDASFDAVLCNLVLSVVPDGRAAFAEAWRVLRPGGRLAVFDKFVPEGGRVNALRRAVGRIAEAVGTDPNRRLTDILGDAPGLVVVSDEPDLLGGQYRIVLVKKGARSAGQSGEEER